MINIEGGKLYHCTLRKNLIDIYDNGLKKGPEGVVYFADTQQNALKFMIIRGIKPADLIVVEVNVEQLDNSLLDYSYDHNEGFFKCKAYIYADDIRADEVNLNFYGFDTEAE